jgi:hypothetical protein
VYYRNTAWILIVVIMVKMQLVSLLLVACCMSLASAADGSKRLFKNKKAAEECNAPHIDVAQGDKGVGFTLSGGKSINEKCNAEVIKKFDDNDPLVRG